MFWLLLGVLYLTNASKCEPSSVPSFSDVIRMGSTMASRFLNSNSFSVFNKLNDDIKMSEGQENNFILLVLRLVGVSNKKVTHFAVDGLISLVHLMNEILITGSRRKRKEKTGSLLSFVLSQPQVGLLLDQVQDPKLVDLVLEESEKRLNYYPEENVDCIKALICRIKPFVQEMQRSLKFFINRENITISGEETCERRAEEKDNCRKEDVHASSWEKAGLEDRMYFFVPSLKEVVERGDECDLLLPNCIY